MANREKKNRRYDVDRIIFDGQCDVAQFLEYVNKFDQKRNPLSLKIHVQKHKTGMIFCVFGKCYICSLKKRTKYVNGRHDDLDVNSLSILHFTHYELCKRSHIR